MAISWRTPGRFAFGNLAPHEVALYESNPELAMQQLLNFYSNGNPNFASTTLGRFIASQQSQMVNDESVAQAAQVTRNSQATAAAAAQTAQRKAQYDALQASLAKQKAQLATFDNMFADKNFRPSNGLIDQYHLQQQLTANLQRQVDAAGPFVPNVAQLEKPLTLTSFMENDPKYSELVSKFNMLPSNQRGANPGSFRVRRTIF